MAARRALEEPSEVYSRFDDSESRRLLSFADDVKTLVSSRFFDGLKLAVTVGEPGVGDTLQAPDDETVRAVVGLFRTLYNDHEPTSYVAILKLVSRHAHQRESPRRATAIDELRQLRKLKTQALQAGLVTYSPSGQALTPRVLVETYINAHYLHKDESRMTVLEDLRGDATLVFEFLSSLERLSRVFLIGRAVVRLILDTPELLPAAKQPHH
jgi:hypothetical protein